MISAFDTELGREVLKSPGNILSLYEDRPNNWDAWDIDFFYRGALQETAEVSSKSKGQSGALSKQLEFEFKI